MKLYLDDVRKCPFGFEVVHSYPEFCAMIEAKGQEIEVVSFDHDLTEASYELHTLARETDYNSLYGKLEAAGEKTGLHCADFFVYYYASNNLIFPRWCVHSANPVGAERIKQLIRRYAPEMETQLYREIGAS